MVTFDAKVSEVESMGNKLEMVKLFITKDNTLQDSTLVLNGRIKYDLTEPGIYKLEFKKSGYVSKYLLVSTLNPPEKAKAKSTLKVEVSLFKYQQDLVVDFLQTKPIGIARFDEYSGKLSWDVDYTRMMIEKIIQATLDLYNKKLKEEK